MPEKQHETVKAFPASSKIPTPPLTSSSESTSNPSSASNSPTRQSLSGIPSKKPQKASAAPAKQTASLNTTQPPKSTTASKLTTSSSSLPQKKAAPAKQTSLQTKEVPAKETARRSISKPPATKKTPPRSESLFAAANSPLSIDEFLKNADAMLEPEVDSARPSLLPDHRVSQLEAQIKVRTLFDILMYQELQAKNETYEKRIERLEKILESKGFLE